MLIKSLNLGCVLLPALTLVSSFALISRPDAGEEDGYPEETPQKEMIKKLREWKVIPDAFFTPPRHELLIKYERDLDLKFGTEVRPAHDLTWLIYNMLWNAQENIYYTIMLIGLDEPSAQAPIHREYLYWLVTNIPICKIMNGHTIAEYQPQRPEKNTGVHRYVYIVYRQPAGKMIYDEEGHIDTWDLEPRYNFSNTRFADKYGYSGPYAANFFTAQYLPPKNDYMKGLTTTTHHPLK